MDYCTWRKLPHDMLVKGFENLEPKSSHLTLLLEDCSNATSADSFLKLKQRISSMLWERHTRSPEIKLWADIIIMTLDLFLTPDLVLQKW